MNNERYSVKLTHKSLEVLSGKQKQEIQSRKFPSLHKVNTQGLERMCPGQVQARDMRPSSFSHIDIINFFNSCMMVKIECGCVAKGCRSTKRYQDRRAARTAFKHVTVSILPNSHIH